MKKSKRPTLQVNEEEEILQFIIDKCKKREPVLREDIIKLVIKFLLTDNRKNPFRNGVPGDKWFSLFRRRHNSHFITLEPDMLRDVENVGFSEKVLNTVEYFSKPGVPVSIARKDLHKFKSRAARPKPPPVHSQSQSDEESHTVPPGSSDFTPGTRLEVMDFNEKWYPVKVVEVDYEEGEVLVHFEKWSDKYDEWVPMDSNRIRRPVLPPMPKKVFSLNEKVLATWAFNEKYPATIRKILPNDKYEVLFCDGYAKILRGCKIFKATEADLQNMQLPPPKKPAPPMGADPLDPNLGPKEERRLKKRRLDVLEAYLPHKKPKSDSPQSNTETSPQATTSTYQPKEMPKVVLKAKGQPVAKRKPRMDDDEDEYFDEDDGFDDGDGDDEEEDDDDDNDKQDKKADEHVVKPYLPSATTSAPRKHKHRKKKLFDESKYVYRPRRNPVAEDDDERWNTEIPEGASPVLIKSHEGYRESVIIPDKKLPDGWTKHTLRRKKGAKWDVLLVNPQGRKFRSRTELRAYFAERNVPFPEDKFDFMVGRKMEMIKSQASGHINVASPKHVNLASPLHTPSDGESIGDGKKSRDFSPDTKRVKTMLPKSRPPDMPAVSKEEVPPPLSLADKRNPDGGYTCCGKTFRKENLFQMHMKHYHPEYSNLFGSTPNVADLAYARTVGEPLEDSRAEAMTPRTSLAERFIQYEAERSSRAAHPEPDVKPQAVHCEETPTTTTPVPPAPGTPKVKEEDNLPTTTSMTVVEEPPAPVTKQEDEDDKTIEEPTADSGPDDSRDDDSDSPMEVDISDKEQEHKSTVEEPAIPDTKEEPELTQSKADEPSVSATEDKEKASVPEPQVSLPVIKPVSRVSSATPEAVIVQTTTSAKNPVTITKYIPPGHKPAPTTSKMTVSIPPNDNKPTIKTLLPMRPPATEPKDPPELPKPKDVKPKEENEEETPVKTKPRKRTVSESLPKKPKLVKPSTGSLEEEPEALAEAPPPTTITSPSYRFSRNRSMPRVSLQKLIVTPDRNGRVLIPPLEDNNTAGRRPFKSFQAANTINETPKDAEGNDEPVSYLQPLNQAFENLRKEEIINCICGYMEEDGLMIQCDLCLCWQHGMCNNIDKEADVPEKYVCYTCLHPARQRSSMAHCHNQDWLKEGQLPSLSFRTKDHKAIKRREKMLKKCHDLTASLLQLDTVTSSLRIKTHIATKPDHPKLYLWAKSWKHEDDNEKSMKDEDDEKQALGPQPEAAIDETECRLRLLEHVEDYQRQVDDSLLAIQAQITALESQFPELALDEGSDHYPITKQTVQMVLHDLDTLRQVAALN